MGGIGIPGGDAAGNAAVAGLVMAVAAAAGLYLRIEYQRYGRLAGWQGQVTRVVPLAGLVLVGFAVWPWPWDLNGLCAAAAGTQPVPVVRPLTGSAAAWVAVSAAVFVPVGFLARYRYRRGWLFTAFLGGALACVVELLRFGGAAELPCAYPVTAVDGVVLGIAGTVLGWTLARACRTLLPRGWPAAVPDLPPVAMFRRALGLGIDLALWWSVAALLAAALAATGAAPDHRAGVASLVGVAVVLGGAVPLLGRDRATLGRMAVHLALAEGSGPAPRWRVLLRSVLYYGPVVALFAAGLEWWAPLVVVLHASTAFVRGDRAGLFDLISGTRVVTRFTLGGPPPARMVLLREIPEERRSA